MNNVPKVGLDIGSTTIKLVILNEQNDQVAAFRTRSLNKTYPVLWVDSLYEQIRNGGCVQNMAVSVVIGLDENGRRDILAIEPMQEESEATYKTVFEDLKQRGVQDVWLVVSDAHKGLVKAVQESFIGCSWQRCKVQFMRNILAKVSSKTKAKFAERLKQIWLQPDYDSAKAYAYTLMDEQEPAFPEAGECVNFCVKSKYQDKIKLSFIKKF